MADNIEVLKALLNRKNKTVPVDDGRKIGLVLFGGIMSGIRGTGALTALEKLGLRNAFDAIYTFSAGLPNAAYFLSGQAELSTTVYADDLSGRAFINWFTPWQIANVKHLLKVLRYKKSLHARVVATAPTDLFVWLTNQTTGKDQFINTRTTNTDEFFELLRAAVTMSVLTPGSIHYRGQDYKDAGLHRARFLKAVLDSSTMTDYFVIYNRPDQVVNDLKQGSRIFSIIPPKGLSRFTTNSRKLWTSSQEMERQVRRIFDALI